MSTGNIALLAIVCNTLLWALVGGIAMPFIFKNKHRDPVLGAVIGVVAGLFGGPIVLGLLWFLLPAGKTCPRCAEPVQAAALVCRHCGYEFPPESVMATTAGAFPTATPGTVTPGTIPGGAPGAMPGGFSSMGQQRGNFLDNLSETNRALLVGGAALLVSLVLRIVLANGVGIVVNRVGRFALRRLDFPFSLVQIVAIAARFLTGAVAGIILALALYWLLRDRLERRVQIFSAGGLVIGVVLFQIVAGSIVYYRAWYGYGFFSYGYFFADQWGRGGFVLDSLLFAVLYSIGMLIPVWLVFSGRINLESLLPQKTPPLPEGFGPPAPVTEAPVDDDDDLFDDAPPVRVGQLLGADLDDDDDLFKDEEPVAAEPAVADAESPEAEPRPAVEEDTPAAEAEPVAEEEAPVAEGESVEDEESVAEEDEEPVTEDEETPTED